MKAKARSGPVFVCTDRSIVFFGLLWCEILLWVCIRCFISEKATHLTVWWYRWGLRWWLRCRVQQRWTAPCPHSLRGDHTGRPWFSGRTCWTWADCQSRWSWWEPHRSRWTGSRSATEAVHILLEDVKMTGRFKDMQFPLMDYILLHNHATQLHWELPSTATICWWWSVWAVGIPTAFGVLQTLAPAHIFARDQLK